MVCFETGSGGGGNAYAIAGKFPDYFVHVTALSGMSDYISFYENDEIGEFQDEVNTPNNRTNKSQITEQIKAKQPKRVDKCEIKGYNKSCSERICL